MNNGNMTATLKYAIVSDKKMLLISKLVKGKKVQEALDILEYTPKKAAKILAKVVKSAAANAVTNGKKSL
jgi:large subunit ribosomal protein L22